MKKTEKKTNALRQLERQKLDFKFHDYVDSGAVSGLEVAAALHESPEMVFKTLVTVGKSGGNYVFVVPVTRELDLKKAAAATGEKSISMLKAKDLFGLTGYVHGGCSPIGMKKFFRTFIDQSAEKQERIMINAGKIGYQLEISLSELAKAIPFEIRDIASD